MSIWKSFLSPMMRHFRTARAYRIKRCVPDIESKLVCDLGGSLHFWEEVKSVLVPSTLIILNVKDGSGHETEYDPDNRMRWYDGKHIPYGDKEIDILLCNSVIEHVPLEARAALCAEIRRVAKCYIIQTPAFNFPIETHFLMPIVHWLPRRLGRCFVVLSPFALVNGCFGERLRNIFDEIKLLNRRDLEDLFPGSQITVESFLGLTKSYLLFGGDETSTTAS